MDRLDALEAHSVYILRESYARIEPLAMLWSLGKDSNVMIWLARKAFFGHVPFPVMHVDTGKKFKEMYEFRDRYAAEWELDRSEEHTSELQSLMRNSYAVFCLKKKNIKTNTNLHIHTNTTNITYYNQNKQKTHS